MGGKESGAEEGKLLRREGGDQEESQVSPSPRWLAGGQRRLCSAAGGGRGPRVPHPAVQLSVLQGQHRAPHFSHPGDGGNTAHPAQCSRRSQNTQGPSSVFSQFLGLHTGALGKWLWSSSSCYRCCLLSVLPLTDGDFWGDAHHIASTASARRMNGCSLWLPGAGCVPGEPLSALRQPRCPQSSRRPPEGALASPVAGSRCPRRALTIISAH